MVAVIPYEPKLAKEWDAFVDQAKNGHFMFSRQYLQYHADRFQDASLLFYHKEKLVALLPAHHKERQLISHGGLTFGGLVTSSKMTFSLMQEVFASLKSFMREHELDELHYRAIPAYYHKMPAQEDLAVLSQLGAKLTARDITSVIDLRHRPKYYQTVRWAINRAARFGMTVRRTQNVVLFMEVLTELLKTKYQTSPVHTIEEIKWLEERFSGNIQLEEVYLGDELMGGMLLYLTEQTVHAQYTAMTEAGKKNRCLPYLVDSLIQKYKDHKLYFSLGTSRGSSYVNENLLHYKESLGARTILQEQYIWRIAE